jgi:hypothetical protein
MAVSEERNEMEARNMLTEAGARSIRDESYTGQLIEKWGRYLEGVRDPYVKKTSAMLFENQFQDMRNQLAEDTLAANAGAYTKYIFPVLRRVFPNLIANELVSVQPMSSPVGAVFFFEYKHGKSKGTTTAGTNLIQNFDPNYSSEKVEAEPVAIGDGAKYGGVGLPLSVILAYSPVRPLDAVTSVSCMIEDVTPAGVVSQTAVDDGAGGFTGDTTAGTLNYATGQITGFLFTAAPGALNTIRVTYWFDGEANKATPDVYIDISFHEIRAMSRRLKARWSAEAADDLRAFHGVEADTELVSGVAQEIGLELDRDILGQLYAASAGIVSSFDFTVPAGVAELDHIRAVLTRMSNVSFQIHKQSGRAPANWYVTSPDVSARLIQLQTNSNMRQFADEPFKDSAEYTGTVVPPSYGPMTAHQGILKMGPLSNKWWGYQDPFFRFNQIMLGLKGQSYMDAAFAFCPYIPLQMTATFTDPEDQTNKKGMRTRYATRLLRSEWFGRCTITGGL